MWALKLYYLGPWTLMHNLGIQVAPSRYHVQTFWIFLDLDPQSPGPTSSSLTLKARRSGCRIRCVRVHHEPTCHFGRKFVGLKPSVGFLAWGLPGCWMSYLFRDLPYKSVVQYPPEKRKDSQYPGRIRQTLKPEP